LLDNPLVNTSLTPSVGRRHRRGDYPSNNGTANQSHVGDPQFDTADFSDSAPGNLRVDYVLPSANLEMTGAGIFWPVDPDTSAPNTTGDCSTWSAPSAIPGPVCQLSQFGPQGGVGRCAGAAPSPKRTRCCWPVSA
jgi:hypothetical protein